MTVNPYHSGLHPDDVATSVMDRIEGEHGVAIRHDLFQGTLPSEFSQCDVFYTELPWKHGFSEFERRAGIHQVRTYRAFLERVNAVIAGLDVPAIIVTGRLGQRVLLEAEAVYRTTLNHAKAVALVYGAIRCPRGYSWRSEINILKFLCNTYDCIGDFCCGYGRTVRFAVVHGKRYVVSDYNPKCIGYIGENLS